LIDVLVQHREARLVIKHPRDPHPLLFSQRKDILPSNFSIPPRTAAALKCSEDT
jgi:hypothetical protein